LLNKKVTSGRIVGSKKSGAKLITVSSKDLKVE